MHLSPSSEALRSSSATWRDYFQLTKPQDALLILVTTLAALFIAGETMPSVPTLLLTVAGSLLAAAGAGALNCYLDRDIDAIMTRTRYRPLPMERIEPKQAYKFGIALCVLSFFVLWMGANLLAAVLSMAGLLTYVVAYTRWFKRRSMQNVFIAGASWAIPPLVGWTAATGSLSITALALFAIVFYWTPIHQWSLGLLRLSDFTRAGIPILPVIKGSLTTRRQIVYYSVLMFVLTLLPAAIGLLGFLYAEAALLLGGVLIFHALHLLRNPGVAGAARLHRYSIIYLALLFTAMMLDRTILS
jgi:protoheme IX farnesyltransferase